MNASPQNPVGFQPNFVTVHTHALHTFRQILRRRHHLLYVVSISFLTLGGVSGALASVAFLQDALPMLALMVLGGVGGLATIIGVILLDRHHRQVQQDLEDHPLIIALHAPNIMRVAAVEVHPDERGRQPVVITLSTGDRYTLTTRPNEVRPVVALFESKSAQHYQPFEPVGISFGAKAA